MEQRENHLLHKDAKVLKLAGFFKISTFPG